MMRFLTLFLLLVLLAAPAQARADGSSGFYVVQEGDWLSKIAARLLGGADRYPEIVASTTARAEARGDVDLIANPDRIEVGQRLWLPGDALLWQQLQTATLNSQWVEQDVTLVDGRASVAETQGSASKVEIALLSATYGDLNEDGSLDAAAVMATDPGGSGTFYTLEAFLSQEDGLIHSATYALGDRVGLQNITAEDGLVTVNMLTAGPDDPLCCPTVLQSKTLRLQANTWVEAEATLALDDGAAAATEAEPGPEWAYKGAAPSAGCCGRDISLYLDVDGQAHLKTDYLNEEPPTIFDGTWQFSDGTVTVALTSQKDEPLAEPQTYRLKLDGNTLISQDSALPVLTAFVSLAWDRLEPPFDATSMVARLEAGEYTGAYKAYLPAASCCGQDITLYLNHDGTARLVSDFMNGEDAIIETGTWQGGDAEVTVTLTAMGDGTSLTDPWIIELLATDGVLVSQETVPEAWGMRFYAIEGLITADERPAR